MPGEACPAGPRSRSLPQSAARPPCTQCLGTKPSSPAAGFGSSSRDAFAKQYASAEVDKAKVRSQGGDSTLGAAYNIPVRAAASGGVLCCGKHQGGSRTSYRSAWLAALWLP